MMFRKGITPIVATALVLVIVVLAVVVSQKDFILLLTKKQANIEVTSQEYVSRLQIDSIIGNTLYLKNPSSSSVYVSGVRVGNITCNNRMNLTPGVSQIVLNNCSQDISAGPKRVVVFSNNFVKESSLYLEKSISKPILNCSALPGSWALVPGSSFFGTLDFCVMVYEVKNVAGIATSQPSTLPWTSITQPQAVSLCSALGSGYHLITNNEWMTLARNIESNSYNWDSGVVGSGSIFTGNSDDTPNAALVVSNPLDFYSGTGESSPSTQRRVLRLTNNQEIWDFAGNVWEWNQGTCNTSLYDVGGWYQWNRTSAPNLQNYERIYSGPSIATYNMWNGVGTYSGCSANGNVFIRGGKYGDWAYTGIYSLGMTFTSTDNFSTIGFRCTYTP